MKTVLVFKTSVTKKKQIRKLRPLLNGLIGQSEQWNFDLEDCDNILRVETRQRNAATIASTLEDHGFYCTELH